MKDISLAPTSKYKEIQDLYEAGFTYEQVLAIVKLICALMNRDFTKLGDKDD